MTQFRKKSDNFSYLGGTLVTSVKSPLEADKIGSNGKKLVPGPQYLIFLISNWYYIFERRYQFWHLWRGDYCNCTQKLIFSKIYENIAQLPQSFLCPGSPVQKNKIWLFTCSLLYRNFWQNSTSFNTNTSLFSQPHK